MQTEIRVKSYSVLTSKRLAEGGFGFVDLVVDSRSSREMVLKRCSVKRDEEFQIVNREIQMLQKFRSPLIVSLLASEIINTSNGREALLLLEYCPGGHLLDKVMQRNNQYFLIHEIYKLFYDILKTVQPLHNIKPQAIVHRDLKLENLLFMHDNTLKLCDFGSCVEGNRSIKTIDERTREEEVISKTTTPMYRAPEMVDLYQREVLTEKTDIWALGCLLYTLCFLKHPFQDVGMLV